MPLKPHAYLVLVVPMRGDLWLHWRYSVFGRMASAPGSVEVRFEDEGPGIEPDKMARIFEPFYTTKDAGVGMGLAVCMRIVTAHDGTIRTTSRENGGTSMSVRLPAGQMEE